MDALGYIDDAYLKEYFEMKNKYNEEVSRRLKKNTKRIAYIAACFVFALISVPVIFNLFNNAMSLPVSIDDIVCGLDNSGSLTPYRFTIWNGLHISTELEMELGVKGGDQNTYFALNGFRLTSENDYSKPLKEDVAKIKDTGIIAGEVNDKMYLIATVKQLSELNDTVDVSSMCFTTMSRDDLYAAYPNSETEPKDAIGDSGYLDMLYGAPEEILNGGTSELLEYFLESKYLAQETFDFAVSSPNVSNKESDFTLNAVYRELIKREDLPEIITEYAKRFDNADADDYDRIKFAKLLDQPHMKWIVPELSDSFTKSIES